jgi:hypothetical protein
VRRSESSLNVKTAFVALFIFELLLFLTFYRREIAWYPPQNYDQAAILCENYRLEEAALSDAPWKLWATLWRDGHPSGLLLPIEGALSGLILGGARLPQLFLNYLSFIAVQATAFYTAHAVLGRRAYGYAAVGLILCQLTPWFWAGGLFDFRMDFFAYCFFGIWTCAVIRSKLLLSRPWALCAGLVGAFLVLHRFLTIIFLFGISGAFATVCLVIRFFHRHNGAFSWRMSRRLFHLTLSIGIIAAISVPIFIQNRSSIYNYYVVAHGVSDERFVRAREVGITDLVGHLLFYPRSIVSDHWGKMFIWWSVALIACGAATRFFPRWGSPSEKTPSSDPESVVLRFIFLALRHLFASCRSDDRYRKVARCRRHYRGAGRLDGRISNRGSCLEILRSRFCPEVGSYSRMLNRAVWRWISPTVYPNYPTSASPRSTRRSSAPERARQVVSQLRQ